MDNEALQKQLSNLQEEQHRKLARMRQKKANAPTKVLSQDISTFGVSDDLNLSTGDVTSSSTVGLNVALEGANTAMREELRELQDETGRLRKVLAEREYEMKRLNKKIMKLEDDKRLLSDAGIASDSASTKIVDLSKKNRDLSAQIESEKSKCFRLQQKVNELERKVNNSPGKGVETRLTKSLTFQPTQNPSEVENLQEQLNSANLKLTEFRNQIQTSKQDMKVALKVLSQETGENQINLQSLLSGGGQGYRGRAQQVIALQDKVKELEQKLKSDFDLNPKIDKNFMRIKNMERTRKEQNDALKDDLMKLQEQHSDIERRLEAAKARNKVLTSEVKSHKSQISVLTDKGSHDNELITTLMRQQDNLQKLLERNVTIRDNVAVNETHIHKELHDRKQQESSEIRRLKLLLSERDARLRQLEEQLNASDSLDEDHKPPATAPPVSQQNIDFNVPRPSSSFESQQLSQKCFELKALYDASENERQNLVKLVSTLSSRVDEAVKNNEQIISVYHEERRKCLNMEQQLETLKTPNKSEMQQTSRDGSRDGHVTELQAQLAIQKDENNALKEALESTLRNKRNDVTMYQEMTQQTKQVFLDALRSFNLKLKDQ